MSSGPECWVFCNDCQMLVSSLNTKQVSVFPEYAADAGYFVVRPMVPATICLDCWRDFRSPAIERSNGEATK